MFKTIPSRTKHYHQQTKAKVEVKNTPKGTNLLFLSIAIIGSLHLLVMLGIETNRYIRTYSAITNLNAKIAINKATLAELKDIKAHENDSRYREQLARKQGFIYPNERRYVTIDNYSYSNYEQ